MNIKKRILVITLLISLGIIIISTSNTYEQNLIKSTNHIKIESKYAPFKKQKNFKNENKERYVTYFEKNKNLNYDKVVTYVNIGLDRDFYSYIKKVNLNKNNLVLVNKYNKLDKNYIPSDLEEINNKYFINGNQKVNKLKKEAKENFEKLSIASIKNNTPVYGQSAYRSYNIQEKLYQNEVNTYGNTRADKESARPGFSEHQTGLSIDVSSTKTGNMLAFENTSSFTWMENNSYKYGFILRYPKNKENIHGYIYEPWHFRYVGIKTATDMHDNYNDLTYDEYYDMFIEQKKDF